MDGTREPDEYRPITRRRRLVIVALAVAMGLTVMATLLDPPGGVRRQRAAPADCAPGQSGACVGGKVEVIVPAAAASR